MSYRRGVRRVNINSVLWAVNRPVLLERVDFGKFTRK